jgi:hydroxysqualene synthase
MPGVDHYENFPVASWLCPAALRPAVVAIYHYARTADDLADEGDETAAQRLEALAAYRQALHAAATAAHKGQEAEGGGPWDRVFQPLARQMRAHALPLQALEDLLDAFVQDVQYTASGHRYATHAELLAYCSRSAQPIGRLLLHLYGVQDARSQQESDAICSALQLINFWQDLGVDLRRGRHYLPQDFLTRYGVDPSTLKPGEHHPQAGAMVLALCQQARVLITQGAPLAWRLPGRIGWELRLVVGGGLRILDTIDRMQGQTWIARPRLGLLDTPGLLWHALRRPAPLSPPHRPPPP